MLSKKKISIITTSLIFILSITTIVMTIIFLNIEKINLNLFINFSNIELTLFFLTLILSIINLNFSNLFNGLRKFKIYMLGSGFIQNTIFLLLVLVNINNLTFFKIIIFYLLSLSFNFLFLFYNFFKFCKKIELKNFYFRDIYNTFNESKNFYFLNLIGFLSNSFLILFFTIMSSSYTVGLVAFALKISSVFSIIFNTSTSLYLPKFINLHKHKKITELEENYLQSTTYLYFFIGIPIILLLFNAQTIFSFFPKYIDSYPVLIILLISNLSNLINGPSGSFISMRGNIRHLLYLSLILFIFMIFISINVFRIYGFLGVIYVYLGYIFATNFFTNFLFFKDFNFWPLPFLKLFK